MRRRFGGRRSWLTRSDGRASAGSEGHRVLAEIELFPIDRGGPTSEVKPGNRSLLFVFSPPGDEPVWLGATFEALSGDGRPGARLDATIWFFYDSAATVTTPGASFDLWHGRVVGRGVVRTAGLSGP